MEEEQDNEPDQDPGIDHDPGSSASWTNYTTSTGRDKIASELKSLKLGRRDVIKLEEVMDRVAGGETREGDVDNIRGPIDEVRCRVRERQVRVLFARCGDGGLLLLALVAFVKKTQTTPASKIQLAEQRFSDWQQRADSR